MATIFDLPMRLLLRLQSLDPMLDTDYQEVLASVFEVLNGESKNILLRHNLNSKSIFYDSSSRAFHYSPPLSFHSTIHSKKIHHEILIQLLEKMDEFLTSIRPVNETSPPQEAYAFCEKLETLLSSLERQREHLEEKDYQDIRLAFFYEFIGYLDRLELTVKPNKRGLTGNVMKIFLKEVFIKHALQGINFNVWDDEDIEALNIDYMPDNLKQEVKNRKLAVIETEQFWFLIAPSTELGMNRYSACRFLKEDNEFGLYTTQGLCLPKNIYKNERVMAIVMELFSSIYTLEMSVSMEVLRFSENCKKAQQECLMPLLRTPITVTGSMRLEDAVLLRVNEFERKLCELILSAIPAVIRCANAKDDRFIFNYYLEKTLNEIWWDLETFNLLPEVANNPHARLLCNRLLSYRLILNKTQGILWQTDKSLEQRIEMLLKPCKTIHRLAEEAIVRDNELDELAEAMDDYQHEVEEGRFFAKLGFGRPKYTAEELSEARLQLIHNTFEKIGDCAKTYKDTMVCFETENPSSYVNEGDYRHYAVCFSKYALEKLPFIIKVHESRHRFSLPQFCADVSDIPMPDDYY